jgi:hypothetical protein
MTRPIVATATSLITPGIDKLVELRPEALPHLNAGNRWLHIFLSLRAQATLNQRRLSAMVRSRRLPYAEGPELIDLVGSEFDLDIALVPTTARGEIVLTRTGTYPSGVIRKGTRVTRSAYQGSLMSLSSAAHAVSNDVSVATGVTSVVVPIEATASGPASNQIPGLTGVEWSIDHTFDPLWVIDTTLIPPSVAGGSNRMSDATIRDLATSYSANQYAPVNDLLYAAALRAGAAHAYVTDDPITGYAYIIAADESWAFSDAWLNGLVQAIYDLDEVGFGCKVVARGVRNLFVRAIAGVTLRDTSYLNDTSEITAAIQSAIKSYLEDRYDFWTFTLAGLTAAVTRAHPKILSCNSVVLTSAGGTPITARPLDLSQTWPATHYYMIDDACAVTYLSPT